MANNFNTPPCKALWEFESGALEVDSRALNPDLTLYGPGTPPVADGDCREGSSSALFTRASSRFFFLDDEALTDGFPLKSNDPAKLATICFWVKFATVPSSGQYHNILTKSLYQYDASFECQLVYSSGAKFRLVWGNAAASQTQWDVFSVQASRWYHVSLRIDGGPNKVWKCRVYDATAGTTNNYTGAPGGELHLSTRRWYIGAYDMGQNCLDGRLDELLFFNDLLSDAELASIQAGTFDFDDARLQARYRFENGAVTADSKGSNPLTASGGQPTADTVDFKTGAASLLLNGSGQHLRITDASLGANFPFKSGDAWRSGTFTGWWKFYSVSQGTLFSRWLSSNYGFRVYLGTNNHLFFSMGYSATGKNDYDTGITVVPGRWYFIGFGLDLRSVTNSYYWGRLYVYDPVDDQVYTCTGHPTTGYNMPALDLAIGAYSDGSNSIIARVDQFAVFDEWLFDAELEALSHDRYNGRNNVLADAGLKAYWDFEDSPGAWIDEVNGKELRPLGAPSVAGVTGLQRKSWEKGAQLDQGGGTVRFFSITDANLDAGFPLKSGDTIKKISVTMWVKPYSTAPTYFRYLFAKNQSAVNYRSFAFALVGTRLKVYWVKYNDQYTTYTIDTGIDLSIDDWHHLGVAVDGAARTLYVRVYRASDEAVFTFTYTPSYALAVNTCALAIGQRGDPWNLGGFHGVIDEVAVFASVLSAADIDSIRAQTYNFAGDADCKALWLFESGALTTDSRGANTLTNNGAVPEASEYRQGSGAALLNGCGDQYLTIADAHLPAGFPLKSGDQTKQISVCFWARVWAFSGNDQFIFCKGEDGRLSLGIAFRGFSIYRYFRLYWGYNEGASTELYQSVEGLLDGRWYHVGVAIDGVARTCYMRVYDYSTKTLLVDYLHTFTNELWVGDAQLAIGALPGAERAFDGAIDEVMVFNRLLSSDEMVLLQSRSFVPTDQQKVVHTSAYFEYGPEFTLPRRVFPAPHPRWRQQSQSGRRGFPVIR